MPNKNYDVYAVCGLPQEKLPSKISETIAVNGSDFAVGYCKLKISNGVATPSVLEITAERQMARLELSLTDVPSNISDLNVYVKGLKETFALDKDWKISSIGEERFTRIPVSKNGTTYSCDIILPPCSNTTGVNYVVEARTETGRTLFLTYNSEEALTKGVHLTQTLQYADLMVLDGSINLEDWLNKTDDGSLQFGYNFEVGDLYLSHEATVVYKGDTQLLLWPHKPMVVTLDEIRNWTDRKRVPYTLQPNINVSRWTLPATQTTPSNIIKNLQFIGWDKFDLTFTATGNTPIDHSKLNIIAYYDETADKFHVYDFANDKFKTITEESGEFLLYPVGIISF